MLNYYVEYFGPSVPALEHLDTTNQLYRLMGHICIGNIKELYWLQLHRMTIRIYYQLLLLLLRVRLQIYDIFSWTIFVDMS